jgi:uncharacterized membrane protein
VIAYGDPSMEKDIQRGYPSHMYALAFLIGIIAGLRTMTAPTAISWAAWSGRLAVEGGWLAFLGYSWTPWIFTLLALGEFVADQLPSTPSRTVPMQFGARLLSGAICGAAIGFPHHATLGGLLAGMVGAVVGTLGGHAFRMRLAASFKKDPPAAFIEDAIAIGGAWLIVLALS